MVTLKFRYIFFITLFHSVFNDRDVVAKYKGYLILEKILNASIIYYNNSVVPLLNVEGSNDTTATNSETVAVELNTKPSTVKVPSSSRTVFYNIEDLNTTSSVYRIVSIILKNTTGPYVIITNKTDVHNMTRPLRRTEDKLDALMEKLDGDGEDEELFYEPFWPDGEFVFKRTGTKQVSEYKHQLDEYRDCDKTCSVFEDRWYGRICAARRDSKWIDIIYKNFSTMCAMERENCQDPRYRPGWYPIHRGPCGYSNDVNLFLYTYNEWYGGCTSRFWTRASSYLEFYEHFMDIKRPGHDNK